MASDPKGSDVTGSSLAELASSGALSETGLNLPGTITREEYESLGSVLGRIQESMRWAIGDYILRGEELFGEDAFQLSESLGISVESRQQYVRVAQAIEPVRRRGELTWSHHRAVYAMEPEDQDRWLDEAVENGWTRGEMDARMRTVGEIEPVYTDRDLLNQIRGEIETFLELWSEADAPTRTMLAGLLRKIEMHEKGQKWWLTELTA
jgi:hypothetical protein